MFMWSKGDCHTILLHLIGVVHQVYSKNYLFFFFEFEQTELRKYVCMRMGGDHYKDLYSKKL